MIAFSALQSILALQEPPHYHFSHQPNFSRVPACQHFIPSMAHTGYPTIFTLVFQRCLFLKIDTIGSPIFEGNLFLEIDAID